MTEEVGSFGGSRWEVQDIKVLAGWPAKPQTPWQPLVAWLYHATPHAYAKMPLAASNVFLSDMHPWTSVRGVRWVNCTSSKELGIYMALLSRSTINPWHGNIDRICFKQTELRKAVHSQFPESAQYSCKARIQVILQRQARVACQQNPSVCTCQRIRL
jgi:hypothetical protein